MSKMTNPFSPVTYSVEDMMALATGHNNDGTANFKNFKQLLNIKH